eukprot:5198652-Amphidinium_carterae.1
MSGQKRCLGMNSHLATRQSCDVAISLLLPSPKPNQLSQCKLAKNTQDTNGGAGRSESKRSLVLHVRLGCFAPAKTPKVCAAFLHRRADWISSPFLQRLRCAAVVKPLVGGCQWKGR